MSKPKKIMLCLHGEPELYDCYPLPLDTDPKIYSLDAPCPIDGCNQELVWQEDIYSTGYRVCMARRDDGTYSLASRKHIIKAMYINGRPYLVHDHISDQALEP